MSFRDFSIFSTGSHFVQLSGTVLAILVEGHPRIILKLGHWSMRICRLKVFLFF